MFKLFKRSFELFQLHSINRKEIEVIHNRYISNELSFKGKYYHKLDFKVDKFIGSNDFKNRYVQLYIKTQYKGTKNSLSVCDIIDESVYLTRFISNSYGNVFTLNLDKMFKYTRSYIKELDVEGSSIRTKHILHMYDEISKSDSYFVFYDDSFCEEYIKYIEKKVLESTYLD